MNLENVAGRDRPAPFWAETSVRAVRRGAFWITGERIKVGEATCQRGPMYVAWEAPETVTRPYPVVLVHGGGLQGTEWRETPERLRRAERGRLRLTTPGNRA